MSDNRDLDGRPQLSLMPWWWAGLGILFSLVLGALSWLVVWAIAGRNPALRIEAIKIGLSVGAGTGGAGALLLAFRRQLHSEHVAQDASYDSTQQRITELYSRAVEQLGHEKAAVRLGGLYALERLAQDNPEHRQTVADVVCAYLRMPFEFDPQVVNSAAHAEDDRQELQVRLTAQRLLIRHLEVPMEPSDEPGIAYSQPPQPPGTYWSGVQINLASALLVDVDFTLCVFGEVDFSNAYFRGESRFGRTRFEGQATFDRAIFGGTADFRFTTFESGGSFLKTRFDGEVGFEYAHFGLHGHFDDTEFSDDVSFDNAKFIWGALFDNARFDKDVRFRETEFGGPNRLGTAQFNGAEPDFFGSTVSRPDSIQDWPNQWMVEPPDEEGGMADLVRDGDS